MADLSAYDVVVEDQYLHRKLEVGVKPAIEAILDGVEPFKIISTRALYDAPPVEFLIDGLLPTHAICGMTGHPGTGKTWLAMEMMRATVTGTKFLGHYETKQAPALLIGSDASLLDYAQQWRRLTKDSYESYAEADVRNPFDAFAHFMIQSEFNLDDIQMVARLIRTSSMVERPSYYETVLTDEGWESVEREGCHYGLIVYDTLTKMTSTPENDNKGRDLVFEHLRDIAEATGATLLVIHHPPLVGEFRTGEEWRGAGSQFGALDVHYHIIKDNGRQDVIQMKVKKFRGITPKPFLFHLAVFDNDQEADLTYMEAARDAADYDADLQHHLVEVLHERGGEPATISDFAIALLQYPEWNDQFGNDVKKMKNRIRNFLRGSVLKPDSPIVQILGGRGRAGSLYNLTPRQEEGSDTGKGDAEDSGGVALRGDETPGVG